MDFQGYQRLEIFLLAGWRTTSRSFGTHACESKSDCWGARLGRRIQVGDKRGKKWSTDSFSPAYALARRSKNELASRLIIYDNKYIIDDDAWIRAFQGGTRRRLAAPVQTANAQGMATRPHPHQNHHHVLPPGHHLPGPRYPHARALH